MDKRHDQMVTSDRLWPKHEAAGPQLRVRYREDSFLKLIIKRGLPLYHVSTNLRGIDNLKEMIADRE